MPSQHFSDNKYDEYLMDEWPRHDFHGASYKCSSISGVIYDRNMLTRDNYLEL